MPYRDPEKRKIQQRRLYLRNRDNGKNKVRDRAKRAKRKGEISDYKLSVGCVLCGYDAHPAALHFHHHNGDKTADVARLVTSPPKYREEMEKCVVVCANCHAVLHAILPPD